MATHAADPSPRVRARVAGLLFLLLVPLGIFAIQYGPATLIVPGDAAKTASNVIPSESLFRFGLVNDLLAPQVLILVVLVLYK